MLILSSPLRALTAMNSLPSTIEFSKSRLIVSKLLPVLLPPLMSMSSRLS
jgi:hypothetical protein